MTRRKQNCPKRMKWEGGEGGEEDGPDSPGSKGDDASSSAMSPGSAASHDPHEDDVDGPMCLTPEHDVPPTSPSPPPHPPRPHNGQDTESMLHEFRDGPGSRCPSRDSRGSSLPRCPSRESLCSERGGGGRVPVAMSPMSVALPATLGPTAAGAFLPPQAAAIAAYLSAGQHPHHRLLMTSPLPQGMPRGSVSPLVSSSSSPPMLPLVGGTDMSPPPVPNIRSPMDTDSAALDFSTKRGGHSKSHRDDDGDSNVLNLSKPSTPTESNVNSPLDLSCSGRKRPLEETSSMSLSRSSLSPSPHPPSRKSSRMSSEYKQVVSPWTSPVVASHFPYFAAAVAAASSLSPKSNHTSGSSHGDSQLWNGKMKGHSEKQSSHFGGMPTPSDATKALEKMSELSKLGGDDLFRPSMNSGGGSSGGAGGGGTGRHSAWQSHWLNKGAEQAKDVLKCVWCKQSFPSLAAMTVHMKDAKHCGVNVPTPIQAPPPPPQHQHQHQHQPPTSSPSASHNRDNSSSNHHSSSGSKPNAAELNLLIKETMPLPRKLVRGQDVWLGKGAEQTRQILKCMWCGQSFRSLAEMTNHMQQTQHYTNIISQEQIISWKSSDDAKPGGPGGGPNAGGAGGGASSHVSAVLTCKVCDQAFSSLKELSNHMVKNSHYKEHIMRSITESGGRRRQTREKRKKSLPVRKLLELERAQHELKNGDAGMMIGGGGVGGKIMRDSAMAGRITCEKCGDKIETSIFVEHIRQCVGGGVISSSQRNLLKNALLSINVLPLDGSAEFDGRKSADDAAPPSRHHRSPTLPTDLTSPSSGKESAGPTTQTDQPSVLNAIEKLIEKSFDSRARHGGGSYPGVPGAPGNAPMGSSILKRLGIDESVDYTKPLVDAQTMNILRSYHHHQQAQQQHFNRRERSGSESSSMSDRGGGRHESLTPDRKADSSERHSHSTPRTTPEKRIQTPPSAKSSVHDDSADEHLIKKEIVADDEKDEECKSKPTHKEISVKKELDDCDEEDDRASYHSGQGARHTKREDVPLTPASVHDSARDDEVDHVRNSSSSRRSSSSVGAPSPGLSPRRTPPGVDTASAAHSPCRNSTSSPASSDRSGTPRSTNGLDKKPAGGSSLGALSSMFDSLSGGAAGGVDGAAASGRKPSSHPLAALQKLCDKTERHGGNRQSGQNAGGSGSHSSAVTTTASQGNNSSNPGSILAFSWACNDAVMTSDSIMKCAFCDTPFISKGAYRHHLSKMHFVKDGAIPDPVALKAHQQTNSGGSSASTSGGKGSGSNNNGAGNNNSGASGSSGKSPQQTANFEESPHSKFLKYTELAKQLSSKYV